MELHTLEGQQIGQYKLLAWLGEGAHVHAYLARSTETGEYRVLKLLKSNLTSSQETLARFYREAQAALDLDHPNVVKVFGYDREGDLLYLVEEFYEGGSLMDRMKAHPGPQPLDLIVRTLEDIAAALDFAHERGIIHRDLKPENILYDREGRAALSDLGVTKYADEAEARSRQGLLFGNPNYMSPEEWQGRPIDARTDIYALGIILFEMLTGELPFELTNTNSVMFVHLAHLMAVPRSVLQLRPDLPPAVEAVVNKAIEKDPERRYQTASQLAADFKAALTDKGQSQLEGEKAMNTNTAFDGAAERVINSLEQPTQLVPTARRPIAPIVLLAILAALLGLLYWWWQSQSEVTETDEA
ncbi:MAG: serine/threonine-protein kinase [Anaerolineae bacterium]|nr:serine/threonine protein kinase [Anaerolineae bacterium]MDW8300418.1 serine/threonine-protein kinase [Anaerolineae bacterium]